MPRFYHLRLKFYIAIALLCFLIASCLLSSFEWSFPPSLKPQSVLVWSLFWTKNWSIWAILSLFLLARWLRQMTTSNPSPMAMTTWWTFWICHSPPRGLTESTPMCRWAPLQSILTFNSFIWLTPLQKNLCVKVRHSKTRTYSSLLSTYRGIQMLYLSAYELNSAS